MILDTHLDIGQVLFGIAAIVVAIPAVFATIAGKRNSRKLDELHDKTETGNGKNLGMTIHDLASTVEAIERQGHFNAGTVQALRDELVMWKAESRAVHDQLQHQLDEGNKGRR